MKTKLIEKKSLKASDPIKEITDSLREHNIDIMPNYVGHVLEVYASDDKKTEILVNWVSNEIRIYSAK